MSCDRVFSLQSVRQRINRKLHNLIPSRELIWDRAVGNYFLHTHDGSAPRLGPVYWHWLIGLMRHIGADHVAERNQKLALQTKRGLLPEEPLPPHLRFHVLTPAHQIAIAQLQRAGYKVTAPVFPHTLQGAADALAYATGTPATSTVTARFPGHAANCNLYTNEFGDGDENGGAGCDCGYDMQGFDEETGQPL